MARLIYDDVLMQSIVTERNYIIPDNAVEVETVKAWLYEIAMNNTDNTLYSACEEIIRRLDGLRVFAREKQVT